MLLLYYFKGAVLKWLATATITKVYAGVQDAMESGELHPGMSAKFTFELEGGSRAIFKPKMFVSLYFLCVFFLFQGYTRPHHDLMFSSYE